MQTYIKNMEDNGLTIGLMNIQMENVGSINTVKQVKSMDQAIRQLIGEGIRQPGCSWMNQPPEGSPMFIFTKCKGRKEGANLFFDNGCSKAVFRKGIPGQELDRVMLAKGKIPIGGVGGIEAFAEED